MKDFLEDLTAVLNWIIAYGPTVGMIAMTATAWFYRWRKMVQSEQLQKANVATVAAKEAVDTLVEAVEVCQAKDVKQMVTDSKNSIESQAVIDASISRTPTISS